MVLFEQARGRDRCPIGVESLVDDVVDPHEPASGRAGELPESRGSDPRVHVGRVRRLDVGQICDLEREVHVPERLQDVRRVCARTDYAGAEFVGLAELEADLPGALLERRVRHVVPEEGEHPLLFARQPGALALCEREQDLLVVLLALLGVALAPAAPEARRNLRDLVDHAEIPAVMDQAGVRPDLAVDPLPKRDVLLEGGGPRKIL